RRRSSNATRSRVANLMPDSLPRPSPAAETPPLPLDHPSSGEAGPGVGPPAAKKVVGPLPGWLRALQRLPGWLGQVLRLRRPAAHRERLEGPSLSAATLPAPSLPATLLGPPERSPVTGSTLTPLAGPSPRPPAGMPTRA